MLLDGKRILVTGVLTDSSIAHSVARLAQEEGAELVLTSFGRAMSLTQRAARRLPKPVDVIELDVTNPAHIESVREELSLRWGALDGVLHAIGFAPESCLGGNFMAAPWEDVATALHVSAYSLKALAELAAPLMRNAGAGSIVGLDFDATVAWPQYDWMGVAKAAFESTARYLARDLGPDRIRVNLVSAGPLRTVAARSIPGFSTFEDVWTQRAPLAWDVNDPVPAAKACIALLSDWLPATTAEIVHADGGFHAMGA
ncbi:MAG: meromycolic acid enoyl-[acyl-carrier-protein] reductase [Acidimicrobiaceae bacterium]|nr:meromycolic acid enoyl-[acyl-carrier-protein] reductase [Acidimicrobiaceae bacterium]MDQ1445299.1 meromycolic acid enoyl-[acyl-carrier-protein] reductase [Acidimicrobiaceae bacterium]